MKLMWLSAAMLILTGAAIQVRGEPPPVAPIERLALRLNAGPVPIDTRNIPLMSVVPLGGKKIRFMDPADPPDPLVWEANQPMTNSMPPADDFAFGLPTRAPAGDEELTIYLLSPVFHAGEYWIPSELCRQGKTITLVVDYWSNPKSQIKDSSTRWGYFVYLGKLDVGQYQFKLRCRQMVKDDTGLYAHVKDRVGDVLQNLNSPDETEASDVSVRYGVIEEKQLKDEIAPEADQPRRWQWPAYQRSVRRDAQENAKPTGLSVGTSPQDNIINEPGDRLIPFQPLGSAKVLLYAVIRTPVDFSVGEWTSARQIVWDGRKATITTEMWRDDGDREKNLITGDKLVVPLTPPAQYAKQKLTVSLSILQWRAPTQMEWYPPDSKATKSPLGDLTETTIAPP